MRLGAAWGSLWLALTEGQGPVESHSWPRCPEPPCFHLASPILYFRATGLAVLDAFLIVTIPRVLTRAARVREAEMELAARTAARG